MIIPGTILDNIYKVIKLLGKGAMGEVYLVERLNDKSQVVVKELNFSLNKNIEQDQIRDLFFREAEFIAKFNHPGLPKFYGIFNQSGRDFLVMEYIKGDTLEEILNKGLPVNINKALTWSVDLCEILGYLHSFYPPIIYRDLKPSNIIISPEGKPRLIDFGISRYYTPGKDTDTFRLGSPGYAAPEQYKGRGQSTTQSDIYSLGVILYQLLTGYDPTVEPFKFPPMKNYHIPEQIDLMVSRAIQIDKRKRYRSTDEFKDALNNCIKEPLYMPDSSGELTEKPLKKEKKKKKQTKTPPKGEKKKKEKITYISPEEKEGITLWNKIIMSIGISIGIFLLLFICGIINSFNKTKNDFDIFEYYDKGDKNLMECSGNINRLATALETYRVDNEFYYPPDIYHLKKKKYINRIPACPISIAPYVYVVSRDKKKFTIYCRGYHRNLPENFPQYISGEGIRLHY